MHRYFQIAVLFLCLAFLFSCRGSEEKKEAIREAPSYLGHSAAAKYVGMEACRACHEDIYRTFIRTGMGQSFAVASRTRSAADFSSASIYDRYSNFHYRAFWDRDSLFVKEYRLERNDTAHSRVEQVNYIIGSGQHTNSHLTAVNGYVHQMPMTFYTQEGKWDLPPGFEQGMNTRFSRKIGLECMSCHNALPDFVMGSENKFRSLPQGIDCERCHGPGSFHVEQRSTTAPVDTSHYIDYSIVNPAKLPVERQFDICQRCHLQGNAILKEGKSFFDYRPGQKLSDYISVFMPRYRNGEDEFIMASHAERLKMSPCFIQSLRKADSSSLRPYRNAMTCVTCHNPHVSVKETQNDVFNNACTNCHRSGSKLANVHREEKKWSNCVSCHMPRSGSTDIPHVTVHDHFIRKPVNKSEKKAIAEFLGLYSVNEKSPHRLTRARAYLDQYEKFGQEKMFLDSARVLLGAEPASPVTIHAHIHLFFISKQYPELVRLVTSFGEEKCLKEVFTERSYDNSDAWAAYRVAEAFGHTNNNQAALRWYSRAVELAPYNPDFRNKLGAAYLAAGNTAAAMKEFEHVVAENPAFATAYSNLGYLRMLSGNFIEARRLLLKGKALDPDNEQLLLNLATCHMQLKENTAAVGVLRAIVSKNPAQHQAARALKALMNE